MNKDNAHLYMPLLQALIAGKTLQYKPHQGKWEDMSDPSFIRDPEHYRIKPEPREWRIRKWKGASGKEWLNLMEDGDAQRSDTIEIIHVREVLL